MPDVSGQLLTGQLTNFGFLEGGATDLFDFQFQITGGALASMMGGAGAGGAVTLTVEKSTFNNSFQQNFSGGAKLNVGPSPGCTGRIGNFVWHDLNGDGVQQAGEPGINGVKVVLTLPDGVTKLTTVTTTGGSPSAAGYYQFANLCAGDYKVSVDVSQAALAGAGFSPTITGLGTPATDSNLNPAFPITLTNAAPGNTDQTIDFGFVNNCQASLGDRVWIDTNQNGIQDGGEVGVNGVLVELLDGSGNPFGSPRTTTTAAGGFYQFTGLCPGYYHVKFTPPGGYSFTTPDQGGDDALDSDADQTTGVTTQITLLDNDNDNDTSWDAGLVAARASLGDKVWRDDNNNGVQDGTEPGLPNVSVSLYTCADVLVAGPIPTDANGNYSFTNLAPGSYYVVFGTLANYTRSLQDQGGNDATDSDADATGRTICTTLDPGENDPTWDAGLVPQLASLGNYVWRDDNGDGVQDGTEPGLPGVSVTLYTCDGTQVGIPTATDANGFYGLTDLAAGDYYVVFGTLPNYTRSPQDQGGNDALDSDADANGRTICTTLDPGENDPTWDAGLVPPRASLGDKVWRDDNNNGVQDGTEPGLPGVDVTLYTCADVLVAGPIPTDANGNYSFTNLAPGSYYVVFGTLPNYTRSPQDQGGNDALDSDADASGRTICTTLDPGENDPTWDAGLVPPRASLGDKVWRDDNNNGVQDGTEPGLPNVSVSLYTCADVLVAGPIPTDANGNYSFTNLAPGSYYVVFGTLANYTRSLQDQGGNDALDSDADANGRTICTTLDPGENDPTWDAGLVPPRASLGDYVWIDTDLDGIQDSGETSGVVGATVQLYACVAGVPTSPVPGVSIQTIGANGLYGFANLVPGSYAVKFTLPQGYAASPANQGTNDALDSDNVNGFSQCVTLAPGENNPTIDAGAFVPAACSVELTKQCAVVAPPAPLNYTCQTDITELSMKWNGTAGWNGPNDLIDVKAWYALPNTSTLLKTVTNVKIGDIVTVSGYANAPNDVRWEIFKAGTTQKLGESDFHISCSDVNMDGETEDPNFPNDCGRPEGDAKGLTGFLNDWIFAGMDAASGKITCTPPTLAWQDSCELSPQPNPSCTTVGKPTSLTFKYVPAGCSTNNNPQGGKYTCSGSVPGSPATITSTTSGLIISPNSVTAGQEFTVSGSFGSQTTFNVGGQTISIHTSCSQILEVGNVFASMQLVGFNGERGGTEVKYRYVVKNTSNGTLNYSLVDKVDAATVNQYLNQSLDAGFTATFENFVAMLNKTTTNTATVNGTVGVAPNQASCQATDSVTVTAVTPPCVTGTVPISADFNGTAIAGGHYVWFHSNFKPKATTGRDGGSEYYFSGASVTLAGTTITLPDAVILYSAAVDSATTTWDTQGDADPSNDRWVTYVPAGFDKEVFLTGVPYQVPAGGLPGGIKGVTMTGSMVAASGSDVDWKWSAAVYTSFSSNPAAIGVKPIEGSALNPYPNSDHVGTPENFKAFVVGGARGGGGSNYTGSWSGTKTLTPCPGEIPGVPLPPQPPACALTTATPAPTFSDKKLLWTITNSGSSTATLNRVTVIWPATNGYLSKVKLDGDNSWDSTIACVGGTCFANITSDMFVADVNKKSIKAGATRVFTLEFQNTASTDLSQYSVVVDFGGACTLSYNAAPPTCSAGLKIGNYVWYDADNDGIQGASELPAEGVSVVLKGLSGATLQTAITDENGKYEFSGSNVCEGGTYLVQIVTPAGYGPAIANAPGSTTLNDSNPNPSVVRLTTGDDLTIDFGLTDGINYCPTSPINGVPIVGSLFVTPLPVGSTAPAGTPFAGLSFGKDVVIVRYDQSFAVNDNTYGTGSSWGHKFGDLVGSDMAQFAFYSDAGAKVLEFKIDTISASAAAPSGYASLGVLGGEGGILSGTGAWVIDATTAIDANLNDYEYCSGGATGNCRTTLLVNSGPSPNTTYGNTPNFSLINAFYAVIDAAAFGANGLDDLVDPANQVRLIAQHNSPAKVSSFTPTVCQ